LHVPAGSGPGDSDRSVAMRDSRQPARDRADCRVCLIAIALVRAAVHRPSERDASQPPTRGVVSLASAEKRMIVGLVAARDGV
jgi:hypothetical protein